LLPDYLQRISVQEHDPEQWEPGFRRNIVLQGKGIPA
jgi:hypothetical protein